MSDFIQFWQAYPLKVGKLAAERMWQRRQPPLSDVLEALAWQTRSDQWQKGYIPHPTTYLSQGRWMDERPALPVSQRSVGMRRQEEPCPICGYPEPSHHSAVMCNQLWLEQEKARA